MSIISGIPLVGRYKACSVLSGPYWQNSSGFFEPNKVYLFSKFPLSGTRHAIQFGGVALVDDIGPSERSKR